MKYGCCTGAGNAEALARAGYDFIDLPGAAIAALGEAEFEAARAGIERSGLPCFGMHASVPASIRLAGPDTDRAALEAYFATLAGRAKVLGCPRIGIGSPLSRSRAPDADPAAHEASFIESLRLAAGVCAESGVSLLLEALRPAETNFINTQAQALEFIDRIGAPNIDLVFDIYHFIEAAEAPSNLSAEVAARIRYLHIAEPFGRAYPALERLSPYRPVVDRLRALNCPAERIAIEAPGADFAAGHAEGLRALKALFESWTG